MKQRVEKQDPAIVAATFPHRDLLPGWFFRVREVSVGQYLAEGTDLWGRIVSQQGGDANRVLSQCVSSARALHVKASRV